MKKTIHTFVLTLGFLSLAQFSNAQETCFHIVKTSNPSPLVSYISEKYGEAVAEHHILVIRAYEKENQVKVLEKSDYDLKMEQFDVLLQQTQDATQIAYIEMKRNRFVLINTIENQLF